MRPASGAAVAVALFLSMLCVTFGLLFFTMFCWKVGSEVRILPPFPNFEGLLGRRRGWLVLAGLAYVFTGLMDTFIRRFGIAKSPNRPAASADELSADGLRHFVAAPE